MREHLLVGRRLFRFSLYFALQFAESNEFIRVRLLAPTIDLQIAQDERALAFLLQKNERVGRPELGRIKHVRILVAGGDDQSCFVICSFHYLLLTSSWLRSIQCNKPSSPKADPIKTSVLKTKTLAFKPR